MADVFCALSHKSLPIPSSQRYSPVLFSESFIVFTFYGFYIEVYNAS